jgi:hypothetical protein
VHGEVFEALAGFAGEICVEADVGGVGVATAPPGFHTLHEEALAVRGEAGSGFGRCDAGARVVADGWGDRSLTVAALTGRGGGGGSFA